LIKAGFLVKKKGVWFLDRQKEEVALSWARLDYSKQHRKSIGNGD